MANTQKDSMAMTAEIVDAIKNGRKVEAIKLLKQEKGLGLKEAKHAVEAYINNNDEVKEAFQANQPSGLSQEHVIQIVVLLIAVLVIYMMI